MINKYNTIFILIVSSILTIYADEFSEEYVPLKPDLLWTKKILTENLLEKKIPLEIFIKLEKLSQFENGRRYLQIIVEKNNAEEQRHVAVSWNIDSSKVVAIGGKGEEISTSLNEHSQYLLEQLLKSEYDYLASPYDNKEGETFANVKYHFRVVTYNNKGDKGSYAGYRFNLFKNENECRCLGLDYSRELKLSSLILMLYMFTN